MGGAPRVDSGGRCATAVGSVGEGTHRWWPCSQPPEVAQRPHRRRGGPAAPAPTEVAQRPPPPSTRPQGYSLGHPLVYP